MKEGWYLRRQRRGLFVVAAIAFLSLEGFSQNHKNNRADYLNYDTREEVELSVATGTKEGTSSESCFVTGSEVYLSFWLRNTRGRPIIVPSSTQFEHYRIDLRKNGVKVGYNDGVESKLERDYTSSPGRRSSLVVPSGELEEVERLRLTDWFPALSSGVYSVELRFRPSQNDKLFQIGETVFTVGNCTSSDHEETSD